MGTSWNIVTALLLGPVFAVIPAMLYSSLTKRRFYESWFLFSLSVVPIGFLNMQGKPSGGLGMYMFETVGIPLLILCTGSIVLGNVEKKSVTPAPRLASKPIFVLSALAVLSSYFGAFPSDEKNDGPETSLAAQSNKPTSDSQTYQPVHDKTYYAKGMQMTRKQLIAQFGPPEIASDGALAYRAVRPENGKDTLCFFHFDRYAGDSEDKAYRLSC